MEGGRACLCKLRLSLWPAQNTTLQLNGSSHSYYPSTNQLWPSLSIPFLMTMIIYKLKSSVKFLFGGEGRRRSYL